MVCSSCILRGEGERKWREEGGETCLWAALDCYADFFAANFSFHGAMAQMSAEVLSFSLPLIFPTREERARNIPTHLNLQDSVTE